MADHEAVIEVEGLTKTFKVGNNEINALRGVDLTIKSTEFVVIFGPSGCGKTTLLNVVAGIETPTKGKVKIRGTDIFVGSFAVKRWGSSIRLHTGQSR